jgi:hypothetical protein
MANTKGVLGLFRDELYARPALPPVVPRAGAAVAPPEPYVLREGNTVHLTSPLPQSVRFFLSYRETQPGQWELMGVYGGTQVDLPVSSGTWAFSAVGTRWSGEPGRAHLGAVSTTAAPEASWRCARKTAPGSLQV